MATSERDIETAFTTFVQRGAGALFEGTGAFMTSHQDQLAALSARYRILAAYGVREIRTAIPTLTLKRIFGIQRVSGSCLRPVLRGAVMVSVLPAMIQNIAACHVSEGTNARA
jgi:hypothetical protein